jgi:hypothetical protein
MAQICGLEKVADDVVTINPAGKYVFLSLYPAH